MSERFAVRKPDTTSMVHVTHDALFAGALRIRQPARGRGYRVNVDAILLAAFAARVLDSTPSSRGRASARHAVDLGSGVGAVGLSLLHFGAAERVTFVEIDPALAELASLNAEENGWPDRVRVLRADVSDTPTELNSQADLIVCNPPYVAPGRGRAPLPHVRSAKYGDLGTFIDAARRIAGRRAHVALVYPALEATDLLTAVRARGLEPKRLRTVHGRPDDKARVILVECVGGKAGGLAIEPPFVEVDARGAPSEALTMLLATPRR